MQNLLKEKNYYKLLNVGINDNQQQISKAKREISRKYHPDIKLDIKFNNKYLAK